MNRDYKLLFDDVELRGCVDVELWMMERTYGYVYVDLPVHYLPDVRQIEHSLVKQYIHQIGMEMK